MPVASYVQIYVMPVLMNAASMNIWNIAGVVQRFVRDALKNV
jgi:hypothetical protein